MHENSPEITRSRFTKSLDGARIYLWSNFPFFYWLLNQLRVHETNEVETAAVDANDNIYINPAFFVGLPNVQKRAFLLAHEVLHPALGIFWRSAGHDPELSNIAHDFVINIILKDEDANWIMDRVFLDEKYRGLGYEQVYQLILKDAKLLSGGQSQSLLMRDVMPSNAGNDAASLDRKAKEWATRIASAHIFSESMGKRSSAGERLLELSNESTVPWQEHLRQAITEACARSRTNWSLPHRRSTALGLYLPREELLGFETTIVVDTSGSISKTNAESALREIQGILEACGGSVRWLVGDSQILADEIIREVPDRLIGCGGTDFRPFFEHLNQPSAKPTKLLVFFTDTVGEFPTEAPDYPVIWAVYDSPQQVTVPFGEIIKIPAA